MQYGVSSLKRNPILQHGIIVYRVMSIVKIFLYNSKDLSEGAGGADPPSSLN